MKAPYLKYLASLLFFWSIMVHATVPSAPKGTSAVMAGFTRIVAKWQPVKGATAYKVYRDDKVVGTVEKPEYADPGLKPGTAYFYKIATVNADGESPAGKALEVRTLQRLSGRDAGTIQKVVAHELGHGQGLPHIYEIATPPQAIDMGNLMPLMQPIIVLNCAIISGIV